MLTRVLVGGDKTETAAHRNILENNYNIVLIENKYVDV